MTRIREEEEEDYVGKIPRIRLLAARRCSEKKKKYCFELSICLNAVVFLRFN